MSFQNGTTQKRLVKINRKNHLHKHQLKIRLVDVILLGRRRQWFPFEEALLHLSEHKPLQSPYLLRLQQLRNEEVPR